MAVIEMYPTGVSARRVKDITKALRGSKVSPATVRKLNKKAARKKAETLVTQLRETS